MHFLSVWHTGPSVKVCLEALALQANRAALQSCCYFMDKDYGPIQSATAAGKVKTAKIFSPYSPPRADRNAVGYLISRDNGASQQSCVGFF